MGINKMISIKSAVQNTFEDTGIDITKDVPVFTRWAVAAEREIGSFYSYRRKRAVLTISDCRAKLPCDAMSVQLVIGGDQGCDCDNLFNSCNVLGQSVGFTQTDTFLVIDATLGLGTPLFTGLRWDIQNDYLVFNSNMDGQKVTIQYLGLETDCDGFPLICENHLEAIVEYIMYKYSVRSRFSSNKMDIGDVKMHFAEWNRLCSHSRAMDNDISESDNAEIVAMLHNPLAGWGLTLGMNRPYDTYYANWR